MFETCNSLTELNAERIKLTSQGVPLIELNNAYNKKRQEILSKRKPFVELKKLIPAPYSPTQFSGVPVAGYSKVPGCIRITKQGFLI